MTNGMVFHDREALMSIVNDPDKVARADETDVYIQDPDSGMLEHNDDHKAVYNDETGEIFGVVTADYQIINPPEFFGPLSVELGGRGIDPEGEIIMFNGGSRGYAELLVTDGIYPVDRTGEQDPVRSGVTVRWSHDGGVSVRASAFAQDGACRNTMRRVSDSIYVKHAGDVDDRVDFRSEWATVLDQLGAFESALESMIDEAFVYTLFDFSGHEFSEDWITATDRLEKLSDEDPPAFLSENARDGLAGFYDLLGFPRYLAYEATNRAIWRLVQMANVAKGDPEVLTAWDAYSAITWALTHQARFDAGSSSDDDYHRTASDILQNPPKVEGDAGLELQRRLRPDEEPSLIEEDAGDAVRRFEEISTEMRAALQD